MSAPRPPVPSGESAATAPDPPFSPEGLREMLIRQTRRWHCRACETCVVAEPLATIRYHARHRRCEGIGGRIAESCEPDLSADSVSAWFEAATLHVEVRVPGRESSRRHWSVPSCTAIQAEALLAYGLLFAEGREDDRKRFRLTLTWLGIPMGTDSYIESAR